MVDQADATLTGKESRVDSAVAADRNKHESGHNYTTLVTFVLPGENAFLWDKKIKLRRLNDRGDVHLYALWPLM